MSTKVKSEVRQWIDEQYTADPGLKGRVDELLAEMELEQGLVALRESRGLSQSTLAKLLDVSQPAVAKLESDKVQSAKLSTLLRYVTALGGRLKIEITRERQHKLTGLLREITDPSQRRSMVHRSAVSGRFVSEGSRRPAGIAAARKKRKVQA
jgi:transcriptional regulator with XRE-family HTH domain